VAVSLGNGRSREARLRKLEEELIRPTEEDACPECGFGAAPLAEPTYEILFDDEYEEKYSEEPPDEDLYCETCGEQIFGVITFADDED
jgi:hypothetical protein